MDLIVDVRFMWGVILFSVTLKVWVGQIIIAISPSIAERIRVIEPISKVDKCYFVNMRGDALWNMFFLWILPVSGFFLIINHDLWPFFGVFGGVIYVYFAGHGIIIRFLMQKNGISIGGSKWVRFTYFLLFLWLIIAVVTIFFALNRVMLI